MDGSIHRIAGLAASQQGLVTRAQLLDNGLSKRQIDHALTTERLLIIHRAVYRLAGSAITDDGALTAGLLLTAGVASHRSAAQLLGLIDTRPTIPEITVGANKSQRAAGLIVHRSSDLLSADICRVRDLRCTTATRTLVDLGSVVSPTVLESALERALHLRMTTVPRLRDRIGLAGRRPGLRALRQVLDLRTPRLAATESEFELLIWRVLSRHHVPLPERQVRVTVGGCHFRLDMAYSPERIFIEGDGFGVHSTRVAFEGDRARQNKLVVAGWLPLLFTWSRARMCEEEVAEQVRAALRLRRESFGSA